MLRRNRQTNRQTDKLTDGLENPIPTPTDIVGVGNNKNLFLQCFSSLRSISTEGLKIIMLLLNYVRTQCKEDWWINFRSRPLRPTPGLIGVPQWIIAYDTLSFGATMTISMCIETNKRHSDNNSCTIIMLSLKWASNFCQTTRCRLNIRQQISGKN